MKPRSVATSSSGTRTPSVARGCRANTLTGRLRRSRAAPPRAAKQSSRPSGAVRARLRATHVMVRSLTQPALLTGANTSGEHPTRPPPPVSGCLWGRPGIRSATSPSFMVEVNDAIDELRPLTRRTCGGVEQAPGRRRASRPVVAAVVDPAGAAVERGGDAQREAGRGAADGRLDLAVDRLGTQHEPGLQACPDAAALIDAAQGVARLGAGAPSRREPPGQTGSSRGARAVAPHHGGPS